MVPGTDSSSLFVKMAVSKGIIDEDMATQVLEESQATSREPSAIMLERGLLTPHLAENLRREVQKSLDPKTIGGYRIIGKIGQGGMGVVYKATQISMNRVVALKVLAEGLSANAEFSERFLREARAAAKVDHPNVVSVYDVGKDGRLMYLAMQYVGGGDADQLAKSCGGSLSAHRGAEIIRDAARGLAAIHEVGLIHRDIKPANIFLTKDGMAKLADLGLSRSDAGDDRMTMTGNIMGTPAFMAPEQARGETDLDIRCDIYSLGATLYALLAGRPPFIGKNPLAIAGDVLHMPFPDPAETCPGLDAALCDLICRCTAKDRGERFQVPDELAAALDAMLSRLPQETFLSPVHGTDHGAAGGLPPVSSTQVTENLTLTTIAAAPPRPAPSPRVSSRHPQVTGPATAQPRGAPAEPWMTGKGQDGYGSWADLRLGEATQRFRWIQPGTFLMGSPQAEKDHAVQFGVSPGLVAPEVQHQVVISKGFWLADSACTQALWQAITGANPAHFNDHPQRPVEQVSWEDVERFLGLLNDRTHGRSFRLATEAEWEYACRAGSTTATYAGDLYYHGQQQAPLLDGIAWYAGNSGRKWSGTKGQAGTWPVKQLRTNAWGLYDMLGNVWEWCADWYGDYPPGPITDPTGPVSGSRRVFRGGAWNSPAYGCRSAGRNGYESWLRNGILGFRLVAQPPGRA